MWWGEVRDVSSAENAEVMILHSQDDKPAIFSPQTESRRQHSSLPSSLLYIATWCAIATYVSDVSLSSENINFSTRATRSAALLARHVGPLLCSGAFYETTGNLIDSSIHCCVPCVPYGWACLFLLNKIIVGWLVSRARFLVYCSRWHSTPSTSGSTRNQKSTILHFISVRKGILGVVSRTYLHHRRLFSVTWA
jgi:hypothetical protein